ncbi:WD repeat-containing protein 61 [Cylindrobasidium torrendii FP15055 ss-10]|uniref:WD repeat-containing protein 61 n=1 Tax=Cylindrobasidium torrendii FP15055 ss-10 TaxID=1314674 RepID=A0A0D7BRY6_9AGAR|nr:WD repeat-containing protein 61 [Cylindrobasidium torrendii FP15055 ss-10]
MSLAFVEAYKSHPSQSDSIWDVVWTKNDSVLSVSADGTIRQWSGVGDAKPPSPNSEFPAKHTLGLNSLSVSPDAKYALYNSIEGLTALWDLTSGEIVGKFESYDRSSSEEGIEPSWTVSLHPNGETYASSGASGNVTIHSAQPGEGFGRRLATLASGRSKFGLKALYSPDGRRVALASESGQIYVFDVETSALATTFSSHAMAVRDLSWSPDSSLLLGASEDKHLGLHDARANGGHVASFAGHSSWVLSVDISPDNRLGLSGSADKTIKVWDIGARAAVSTLQDNGEVWAVSWRPVASTTGAGGFVSGGQDGVVRWWRGAGGAASTY